MRSLTTAFAATAVLFLAASPADAGCKTNNVLTGSVGANQTDQRSFTISRPGATIYIKAAKAADKLSLKVDRPSGAEACKERGPMNPVVCFPTVKNKTGEGIHTIYVINRNNRTVKYSIQCRG